MSYKAIAACVLAAFLLIGIFAAFEGALGYNSKYTYQVHTGVRGKVTVIERAGWYMNNFGAVSTYPRTLEAEYTQWASALSPNDDSIKVVFNDGGTAKISSYLKIALPTSPDLRLRVHEEFGGSPKNIVPSLKSHLENCIKASGGVMSASENQASRKSEFNQIIEEQLARGLFKMRRTNIELDDLVQVEQTSDGKTIERKAKVAATEIVMDEDKHPVVIQPSPLAFYGFNIRQFSINGTDYDEQTEHQFAAKKDSYLKAEQAKAQRQEEVQQRLMIEEKGRRQVAEVEARENQKKTEALIQAQQRQEVAVIAKAEAATQAQQKQEVAVIAKAEAVTKAQQNTEVADQARKEAETLKEIARIKVETAQLEGKAVIATAEARKQQIELGGGISEKDRVLAEIEARARVGVAEANSKRPVPGVVIAGGGGASGDSHVQDALMSLILMEKAGIEQRYVPSKAASSK